MSVIEEYHKCRKEYKAEQSEYTTKPIDYTGCDLVIAEHLKRDVGILCEVWDYLGDDAEEAVVIAYSRKQIEGWLYTTTDNCFRHAKPIPKPKKHLVPKRVSDIIRWCEENGYVFDRVGDWVDNRGKKEGVAYVVAMMSYTGDPLYHETGYEWLPEWLEEVDA